MKELSIEEKAKAYDETLDRARKEYKTHESFKGFREMLVRIFPGLAVSDDEKIREKLLSSFKDIMTDADKDELWYGLPYNDIIAWLEKHGEQETDKWKEGNIIRHGGILALVVKGRRAMKSNGELFTVQYPNEWVKAAPTEIEQFLSELENKGEQKLIDKIQLGKKYRCIASPRYSTFMTGETYKPEDKFLCSLMNFCSDCFELIEDGEQNPTEDVDLPEFESYLCLMFQKFRTKGMCTNGEIVDFVKEHSQKLKDTLCHAWSEEDETALDDALWCCKQAASIAKDENDMGNIWYAEHWLKSLRERYTWKPSDEQMDALDYFANSLCTYCDRQNDLRSLFNDLKRLREE